jgi:hypothetical protein
MAEKLDQRLFGSRIDERVNAWRTICQFVHFQESIRTLKPQYCVCGGLIEHPGCGYSVAQLIEHLLEFQNGFAIVVHPGAHGRDVEL